MKQDIFSVEELGGVIKAVRKLQGLTQEDLAGISNTGRRFIVELEHGKETAHLGKTLKVMKSLGLLFSISRKWE